MSAESKLVSKAVKLVALLVVIAGWLFCVGCADQGQGFSQALDGFFTGMFGGYDEQGRWQPGAYTTGS